MKKLSVIAAALFLAGCASQKNIAINANTGLRFIGEYVVPYPLQYKSTTIGGLSGIDYDAKNNLYYIICDDGSKIDPARFYTAKIAISNKGIDTVAFVGMTPLLQPNGAVYDHAGVDPEAMRYNPKTDQLFWSSEGERTIKNNGAVLKDPFVHITDLNGHYIDSFLLPANMHMHQTEAGPRNNGTFEGLAFDGNYKTLYVSVEEPVYEDGPRAGAGDSTAWIRILKFDAATKKPLAQYAYKIDAVVHPASPSNGFKINGISDIMWVGENKLLTIERSFSTGYPNNTIKVYLADLSKATDVTTIGSLKDNSSAIPVFKKLLLNMDSLGSYIDNIEGVTFGPLLPNKHQSLLFIADNNFSATQKTQLLLFEVE